MPVSQAANTESRPRKGVRTRDSILRVAVDLASVEGLEGLTIGRLADELKLSKSGLFAHFGSKEELQLATIEMAREIFVEHNIRPALAEPEGVQRLLRLCQGWLKHVEGRVFKGGCFFGAASAEFDDRKYTGSHYGHICFVRVTPKSVTLADQRDGSMRNDIYAMKDPSQKADRAKLLVGRSATYPIKLEQNKWYTMVVETVGDTLRVTIDNKPAGYLKSSGIAHETKSKIELGVAGKDGLFDDIKVWNADPPNP